MQIRFKRPFDPVFGVRNKVAMLAAFAAILTLHCHKLGYNSIIMEWLLFLPALLIAITVHEFAHAWMADHLGDPTPQLEGRLSLNPLKHLDPVGTLMLLVFRFGWGKPVMFDPYNLRHPRRDGALISLAGPGINLVLATICSLLVKLTPLSAWAILLVPLIIMNINLAIFNLLPVAPLDGEKILAGILPRAWADEYQDFMRAYGMVLLILLILPLRGSSLAISLIMPVINLIAKLLL